MAHLESLKGTALGDVLAQHRERLNDLFHRAAAEYRRLDPEELKRHLRRRLAPLVEAVAVTAPERTEAVTLTLYQRSLELVGRGFMTEASRYPAMESVWEEILPRVPIPLASQPKRVSVSLTNAAFHLSREPGVDPRRWLGWLRALAPKVREVEELLALGQVLAWRSGMAHYRVSAAAKWETLGDDLKYGCLGFSDEEDAKPDLSEVRRRLARPWHRPTESEPAGSGTLTARLGGFRGFGGRFLEPPEVRASGEQLFVLDGGRKTQCYTLHADCYGATLKRSTGGLPPGAAGERASVSLPGYPNPASLASSMSTIALTQRRSHYVFLFPLS